MKIISNFKDYYDFLPHLYGGPDPKIVYIRNHKHISVPDLDLREWEHKCVSVANLRNVYMLHYDSRKDFIPEVRGIVVGNKIFSQIKDKQLSDYRMLQEDDVFDRRWSWSKKHVLSEFVNRIDYSLIDLCKFVGIPVFMFNVYRNTIRIDMNCPNLGKLGVASYIPAEQMYQDLSYFIGNMMKDSPDMMKPVVVDDKYKIIGHGFDYKSSFRNVK